MPSKKEWIPKVGERVQLSAAGWQEGLVRSPKDAIAAQDMSITEVEQMGPDAYAIEVTGPLNIYLLNNMTLELKP